jgi:hypothetical protein
MQSVVYLVPPDTEVPEVLNLSQIDDKNLFICIAEAYNSPDGTRYICVTDGDLDFFAKHLGSIPFEPTLLTNIPSVRYSQHFRLCQTVFNTVTYDALEKEKTDAAREQSEQNDVFSKELESKAQYKPPTRHAIPDDDDNFSVEEA